MQKSAILVGLALGVCTFAVAWATIRHFTGLEREHSLALMIAIALGIAVGVGWVILESRLFDSWVGRRRR
jgi:uncharacterized membrane protein YadS